MAGPWEQYQGDGPWTQYQVQAPSYGRSIGTAALENAGSPGSMAQATAESTAKAAQGTGMEPIMRVARALDPTQYLPTADTLKSAAQKIGFTPTTPQEKDLEGMGQKAVSEGVGALANPISWLGPGGAALKAAGAVAGGAGAEAGRAVGGTPGAVLGGLAGGGLSAAALGPKAATRTIDYQAVKDAAAKHYNDALQSGLELAPKGVGLNYAYRTEQSLQRAGLEDTAVHAKLKTMAEQGFSPSAAAMDAGNLDALRKYLGRAARETTDGKSTPNAVAGRQALDNLNQYLENVPKSDVMAGDAQAFLRSTRLGNANYAASQRMRQFDRKVTAAENASEGGIATQLDNQLKSKSRQLLNAPEKLAGWSPEELAQLQRVNSGTMGQNLLRQLGRGAGNGLNLHALPFTLGGSYMGGNPMPLALHAGVWGGGHLARRLAERGVTGDVSKLQEMLGARSPYAQSLPPLPPPSRAGQAQLGRGALLGLQP